MAQDKTYICCVVVGDGGVGKTCLRFSYTKNEFPREYKPTTFETQAVSVDVDGKNFTLVVSDTSGQDDYDELRRLSYIEADVFVVCFSVISPSSWTNVRAKWVPDITTINAPFILVGTKTDLRDDEKTQQELAKHNEEPITVEKGKQLAKDIRAAKYLECSSLERKGLTAVFEEAIKTVLGKKRLKKKCVIM